MSLAIATLIAIIIIIVVMMTTTFRPASSEDKPQEVAVIEVAPPVVGPDSAYDYGYDYTSTYDYIPAYSYGTTREYKMRHGRHMWAPRDIHSPSQHARNIGHLGVRRGRFPRTPKLPSFVPPMGRPMPLPGSYSTKTRPDKPKVMPTQPTPMMRPRAKK